MAVRRRRRTHRTAARRSNRRRIAFPRVNFVVQPLHGPVAGRVGAQLHGRQVEARPGRVLVVLGAVLGLIAVWRPGWLVWLQRRPRG